MAAPIRGPAASWILPVAVPGHRRAHSQLPRSGATTTTEWRRTFPMGSPRTAADRRRTRSGVVWTDPDRVQQPWSAHCPILRSGRGAYAARECSMNSVRPQEDRLPCRRPSQFDCRSVTRHDRVGRLPAAPATRPGRMRALRTAGRSAHQGPAPVLPIDPELVRYTARPGASVTVPRDQSYRSVSEAFRCVTVGPSTVARGRRTARTALCLAVRSVS
jgi:hypothetical protein